MHEHAIAAKIVAIVEEEIAATDLSRKVRRVVIEAGRMHALVPDSLRFHFEVIIKDKPRLESAELVLRSKPITAECGTCRKVIVLDDPVFVCHECHGAVRQLSGNELLVDSIELDEN
ncbi:MAG: hypothetical protein A2X94_13710 [Bdellovibrionales bacterium GWB1_55_8]|nr:MAG: hypothetical protein A2X94_13710 [Bdellovibrionales bacterium GWB1_55_8]